jgi:hypothetical protein
LGAKSLSLAVYLSIRKTETQTDGKRPMH